MASARLDSSRLTRRLHLLDDLALPQSCSRTAARVALVSPEVVHGCFPTLRFLGVVTAWLGSGGVWVSSGEWLVEDFMAVSLAPSGVGKLVSPSLRAFYWFFRSVLFAPALWRHRLAPCLVASLTSARSSVDCLSFGWVVCD